MTSKKQAGHVAIALAIVWAGVFISVALLVLDTPGMFGRLLPVLFGAAVCSMIIVASLFEHEKSEGDERGGSERP